MKHKRSIHNINIIFFISCFLCIITLSACGRRSDPVLLEPRHEKAVEKKTEQSKDIKKDEKEEGPGREAEKTVADAPTGLVGVYTGQGIVITWNEIEGRDIKLYRIYRSTGGDYTLAGETVTPAFTDKTVKVNMTYYYKVAAVGATEGPPSKEILITTENH
ncbi:MAG: hypothetical protein C4560_09600 [Nitrospiraceae bacterium]|nr:MAG: hypothetical protein C4560_09600 [Nitrospiraceae bacterium]